MPVYIELFHGRQDPKQQLDDWGELGPVLGPYPFVHTTYACELKLGGKDILNIHFEMVYYGGMYYGDWSVFGTDAFRKSAELRRRLEPYQESKARITGRAVLKPAKLRRH